MSIHSIIRKVLVGSLATMLLVGCEDDEDRTDSGVGGIAGKTSGGAGTPTGTGGLGRAGTAGRGSGGITTSTGGKGSGGVAVIGGSGGVSDTGAIGGTGATGGTGNAGGKSAADGGSFGNGGINGAAGGNNLAGSTGSTTGAGAAAGMSGSAGETVMSSSGGSAGTASVVDPGGHAGMAGIAGSVAGNGNAGSDGGLGEAGKGGVAGSDDGSGQAGNGGAAGSLAGIAGSGGFSSCQTIKRSIPTSVDGVYSIDPDGVGGNAPFEAYCDMTSDGGGWTLVSKVNSADAHGVSEPRGFIGKELNLGQMLDTAMRANTSPAAHGFNRILPLVTDDLTVAKFELVNGSNPTERLPFYKVVIGSNLPTWFDESEPTATLTCIDAALTQVCTESAFQRLSGGNESAQILAGMTLGKHGLSAAGEIHLRVDGDYVADYSGIWSGNGSWRSYDTYWGNGLLIWFRDQEDSTR